MTGPSRLPYAASDDGARLSVIARSLHMPTPGSLVGDRLVVSGDGAGGAAFFLVFGLEDDLGSWDLEVKDRSGYRGGGRRTRGWAGRMEHVDCRTQDVEDRASGGRPVQAESQESLTDVSWQVECGAGIKVL